VDIDLTEQENPAEVKAPPRSCGSTRTDRIADTGRKVTRVNGT
jgi:hypothetical protein